MARLLSKRLLLAVFLLLSCIASYCADKDLELIRQRIKDSYLKGTASEIRIKSLMGSIREDGSWPDIDYSDTRRIAFQHSEHLAHMVEMAKAYGIKESPLYHDKELKGKLFAAIDFWNRNDFICENWWNNEIGTPSSMLSILYIVDDELGKQRSDKMLLIASRANMKASGARPSGDRVKVASLYAQAMLWKRDTKNVKSIIRLISSQMRYLPEDEYNRLMADNPQFLRGGKGLQPDFSFHHREDRVNNTLTYGYSHANTYAQWARLTKGTSYQFPEESIHLLADYFLDGICKQRCFARTDDPGLLNRDASRPHSAGNASLFIPEVLLELTDYRKDELENVIGEIKGTESHPASFAKSFFSTDYFSFQRPGFFASVRMFSTRCASMEQPYNGEGILNHFRGDGTNYLTVKGNEYLNIYPTFDFRKVPGITCVQKSGMPDEDQIQQHGLTSFAGGVDDGLYGAAAFDFISPIDNVHARKGWFFLDSCYVCLGSGISYEGTDSVFTTINQCFLNGDVHYGTELGRPLCLPSGHHEITNIGWVNHDNVGYVFPDGCRRIYLQNENVQGSWARFSRQTTVDRRTKSNNMFTLSIDHGANIKDGSYEYIVLPGADTEQTIRFTRGNGIRIWSNTRSSQSVSGNGICYIVFYEPGKVTVDNGICISSSQSCMVLARIKDGNVTGLTLSDPSRKSSSVHLEISSGTGTKTYDTDMPKADLGGSSVKVSL